MCAIAEIALEQNARVPFAKSMSSCGPVLDTATADEVTKYLVRMDQIQMWEEISSEGSKIAFLA